MYCRCRGVRTCTCILCIIHVLCGGRCRSLSARRQDHACILCWQMSFVMCHCRRQVKNCTLETGIAAGAAATCLSDVRQPLYGVTTARFGTCRRPAFVSTLSFYLCNRRIGTTPSSVMAGRLLRCAFVAKGQSVACGETLLLALLHSLQLALGLSCGIISCDLTPTATCITCRMPHFTSC
jgi:hypothetical protein